MVGDTFHALAHEARRTMVRRLAHGELTVGALAEPLHMSLAAASKHVKVLERAGLVSRTVDGRRHVCRLERAPLAAAAEWLRFPEHSVVRIERALAAPRERVYRAWLDPEVLRRWMAPGSLEVTRAEVDEREGGFHRIWHGEAGGFDSQLLALVPGERIVFMWHFVGPERIADPGLASRLAVELRDAPGPATTLTLVHDRLEAIDAAMPGMARSTAAGWGMALDKLAAAL